ncbi:YheC/YheD family protein [Paenibacillus senegalensis]|uniref:YheC/YheD family protein n=1 Tax=Paenibacillus senegalensis TaxID=1465766 RepID=UPI000287FAC5|nr:YheC/YheD family protein [Paenibacillus senegalensis]
MKKNYKSSTIVGKLKVYRYLSADSRLKKHLPQTMSFSRKNLRKMASRHSVLYIKPNVGSLGLGIFKVTCAEDGYTVKTNKRTRHYEDLNELYAFIKSKKEENKKLIIQKGIRLDRVQDKPYDLRAMVQRKPRGKWTVTGVFAKVGKAGKIVTNFHQGGRLMKMSTLFRKQGVSEGEAESRLEQIEWLALTSAKELSGRKKGMHEMGIDIALDEYTKQPYVLEVNSRQPQFYPLKKLSRKMYQRMMSYARAYGRKHG